MYWYLVTLLRVWCGYRMNADAWDWRPGYSLRVNLPGTACTAFRTALTHVEHSR